MKTLIALALVAALAGCSTYTGPSRGYSGQVDTTLFDFSGVSTTYGVDEKPMQSAILGAGIMPDQTDMVSTMKSRPDGSFEMTGPGVFWHGMAAFCRVARNSPFCGADPPPEMLAAFD